MRCRVWTCAPVGRVSCTVSDNIKAVEMEAEVRAIKTMADGTVNITYNVPEYCKEQAKKHIDWHGELVKLIVELQST